MSEVADVVLHRLELSSQVFGACHPLTHLSGEWLSIEGEKALKSIIIIRLAH